MLGDRVKEKGAGSLTGVGGGSQNTLSTQLGGDPLLLVPKSLNFNLILRLLPPSPDWYIVAVVAW